MNKFRCANSREGKKHSLWESVESTGLLVVVEGYSTTSYLFKWTADSRSRVRVLIKREYCLEILIMSGFWSVWEVKGGEPWWARKCQAV